MESSTTVKQLLLDITRTEEQKEFWEQEYSKLEQSYDALAKDCKSQRDMNAKLLIASDKLEERNLFLEEENGRLQDQIIQLENIRDSFKPAQLLYAEIDELNEKVLQKSAVITDLRVRLENELNVVDQLGMACGQKDHQIMQLESQTDLLTESLQKSKETIDKLETEATENRFADVQSLGIFFPSTVFVQEKAVQTNFVEAQEIQQTPIGSRYGRPSLATELRLSSAQLLSDSYQEKVSISPSKSFASQCIEDELEVQPSEVANKGDKQNTIVVSLENSAVAQRIGNTSNTSQHKSNNWIFLEVVFWIGLYFLLDTLSRIFCGAPFLSASQEPRTYGAVF